MFFARYVFMEGYTLLHALQIGLCPSWNLKSISNPFNSIIVSTIVLGLNPPIGSLVTDLTIRCLLSCLLYFLLSIVVSNDDVKRSSSSTSSNTAPTLSAVLDGYILLIRDQYISLSYRFVGVAIFSFHVV